jgi:hypothetical protein
MKRRFSTKSIASRESISFAHVLRDFALTKLGVKLERGPDTPLAGLQGVWGLVPGANEGRHAVAVNALVTEGVPERDGRPDPLLHGAAMHPLGGIIMTEAK